CTGSNYQVGTIDSAERLSQSPCRKDKSVPERSCRIQKKDIQVALQLQMLESIIQNKYIRLEPLHRKTSGSVSAATDYNDKPRQIVCEETGLVTCLRWCKKPFYSVRHDSNSPFKRSSISPRKDSHFFPIIKQIRGNPGGHRSFSGASDSQIPHGNHRPRQCT